MSMKHASRVPNDTNTWLEATLSHMGEHFQSVQGNMIFDSCTVLNPLTWPENLNAMDFGRGEMLILKEALCHVVNPHVAVRLQEEDLIDEWHDSLGLVTPSGSIQQLLQR